MFFSELSLFASLPRMLTAEKLLQDDVPDFVYLSLAGLQVLCPCACSVPWRHRTCVAFCYYLHMYIIFSEN